ncbi:MAG: BON domain-containing protein [Bacteroidales bacterium]
MKKYLILTGMLMAFFAMAYPQTQTDIGDVDIADAIEDEYIFDHAINTNNINVIVIDGIVQLTGRVDNIQAKERATNIARLVKGVRSVSNRITVDPPGDMTDSDIRNNVELALMMDPATNSYEVNVSVINNKVILTGLVDSYQKKQLSEHVAKSVKGVVALDNLINVDYKRDRFDTEIKREIEELLKWNILVDDGLINVKVAEGAVTLTGVVGSAAEKYNAYLTAWVGGVKSVDNAELEVAWWAEDKDLRKNKYVRKTDDEIEQAIKNAAFYDPRIYSFNIDPESDNGWVTLRGEVDNLKARKVAGKLAENTTGVVGVTNRIKVTTADLPPDDAEIKSEIQSRLENNVITEAWQISVMVRNGIVTLSGTVDSYLERSEAEWVASGVEGVYNVNNILDVNYPYSYYWYGHYPYYDFHIIKPDRTYVATMNVPDDDEIKRNVERQLWWCPFVDSDDVEVTVENGDVTLEGAVNSIREYRKASENAWEGGAWTVDNQLTIKSINN